MSRSASLQFTLFTREAAERYLARASKASDSHGDRLAAQRACETFPTPMPLTEFYERFHPNARAGVPWHNGRRQ